MRRRHRWHVHQADRPVAAGKQKPAAGLSAKKKAGKGKTATQAKGNVAAASGTKAPNQEVSKKAAKAKRREIMRQHVRSFVGNYRKEIQRREEEAEKQRAPFPFMEFRRRLEQGRREVFAEQQERMRLLRDRGPGRMGELGGTVTHAFSIPADLDEELEEVRESLGMGRSEFYETVFEHFLDVFLGDGA